MINMEGQVHLSAAGVLDHVRFHALVNVMSHQTHDLLFSRQRAPKLQQSQQQRGQQSKDRSTERDRGNDHQSTWKVVRASIDLQGTTWGDWLRAAKAETLNRGQKELSHGNSASFQHQKPSLQRGHLTDCHLRLAVMFATAGALRAHQVMSQNLPF
jgi:hypothetical protein